MKVRNTFIIFLVSGFWHGANWTFVIWGLLNAIYFLPLLLSNNNRQHLETVARGRVFPSLKELGSMLFTFFLTVIAWVFFRAETVEKAWQYVCGIFSPSLFSRPKFDENQAVQLTLIFLLFFILIEWTGRQENYALEKVGLKWKRPIRWAFYSFLIFLMGMYMQTEETPFIYFQF